jgi:small subunit ribosomal protein S16
MLKIRLRRMGARNAPFYRVVVSDSRRRPTAVAVEEVGYYDPTKHPATVKIDHERVDHWVRHGAQISHTVQRLLRQTSAAPQASA